MTAWELGRLVDRTGRPGFEWLGYRRATWRPVAGRWAQVKESSRDLTDGEALALELSLQRAYEVARRARGNMRTQGAGDDAMAVAAGYIIGTYEDG